MLSTAEKGRDFNPKLYSNVARNVQVKDAEYLLSLYDFHGNENLLDIGSGDGQITAMIAKKIIPGGIVSGVDISPDMVKFSRAEYPETIYPNLYFSEANAENFSTVIEKNKTNKIGLNNVDVIFSNHTLHWLYTDKAHVNAVKEMSLCLKQNGIVLLCFATKDNFKELFAAGFAVAKTAKWSQYFSENDLKSREFPSLICYQQALENTNFKIEVAEIKNNWRKFSTQDDFATWVKVSLRTFMSKLYALSDDEKMSFAREVVDKHLEITKSVNDYPHSNEDESIYLRDVMIFIKAIKQ